MEAAIERENQLPAFSTTLGNIPHAKNRTSGHISTATGGRVRIENTLSDSTLESHSEDATIKASAFTVVANGEIPTKNQGRIS